MNSRVGRDFTLTALADLWTFSVAPKNPGRARADPHGPRRLNAFHDIRMQNLHPLLRSWYVPTTIVPVIVVG
jgi:hypothetical protein